MAWKDTLLDASFRGVVFDCESTRDSAKRDVAQHEYPYQDGADTEDLGRKARQVSLTAVFFGNDYETRLRQFMQALDTPGAGELIHPVFGSIKQAQLLDYEIQHDADSVDTCRISLNFVEHTTGQPFFVHQLPAQQAALVSQLANVGRNTGIAAFASTIDTLRGAANPAQLGAMRSLLIGTLSAIRAQVQGMIGGALDVIDYPRSFAAEVMGLIGGMVDLRGFDVGVIMSDWQSLASQLESIVQLPAQVAGGTVSTNNGTGNHVSGSVGSVGTGGGAGGNQPGTGSSNTTTPSAADIATLGTLLQLAQATTLADAAAVMLAAEADQPTLSPPEIERLAADVRATVQASIHHYRAGFDIETARPVTEALKDMALAVQTAAAGIITLRPPLIRRRVEAAANLHLLAHHWYGDYTRAAELARLNPQLTNPNFIAAGDTLNAYAR